LNTHSSEWVYVLFPNHTLSRDTIFDIGQFSKSSNKKFQLMLIKTLEVSHTSIVYNLTKSITSRTCYKWASLPILKTFTTLDTKYVTTFTMNMAAASATKRMLVSYIPDHKASHPTTLYCYWKSSSEVTNVMIPLH